MIIEATACGGSKRLHCVLWLQIYVLLISRALVIVVFNLTLTGLATLSGWGMGIFGHFTANIDYSHRNINLKISKLQPDSVARPVSVK